MELMMSPWVYLLLLSGVAAESTPSSLLGPRHYNHHAYEQYLKEVEPTKQGPVLFPNDAPPPPRPPLIVTSRPLIDSIARSELNPAPQNNSLAQQSVLNRVAVNPYLEYRNYGLDYESFFEKFIDLRPDPVNKNKRRVCSIKCTCRQEKEQNITKNLIKTEELPTLAPIFKAIADHANQNLKQYNVPVQNNYRVKQIDYPKNYISNNINDDDNSDYDQAQNYAFSYTVRDHKTGDDFSHSQHSSGSATNGEYRVRLPDGRMQIVSYTADKNGYNADVRYDDDKTSGNSIDYGVNRNFNNDYNRNQNYLSGNVNYNRNQNHNNYKDTKTYNVKIINDVDSNAREDTKPVVEPTYKDDYSQYGDSKELYGTDYSAEYEDKYNNYDPHKSKFTAFSGPKNPKFVPRKSYSTASTVRPSYEELKPLFIQKKAFKTPLPSPTNDYLYSSIPISINVPSTTPSPYFDVTTERVVIIGTKPSLYTNIRSSIAPPVTPISKYSSNILVTPGPKYSPNIPFTPSSKYVQNSPVTTPRSFLVSTIASIANLKKNIDFSGVKPAFTNTFIDKINKYLSYN